MARRLIEMQSAARVKGLQILVSNDKHTKTNVFTLKRVV